MTGATNFYLVAATGQLLARENELVVEREEIIGSDPLFLPFLAVDPYFDDHVGRDLLAGTEEIRKRLDTVGRIARVAPIGRMLAIVEQIFDESRRPRALGVGTGQQLEIKGVRFDLAPIPAPPLASLGKAQIGRFVFFVFDDVLFDVAKDHGQLFGVAVPYFTTTVFPVKRWI